MSDFETDLRAFARERVTVDDTAGGVGLTRATYEADSEVGRLSHTRAKVAKLFVEGTNNIILAENGGAPSATNGITMIPGQFHVARGLEAMRKLKMNRSTASNGEVEVVYYR